PKPEPEGYELDLPGDEGAADAMSAALASTAPAAPSRSGSASEGDKCPSCNSPLRAGAVICLNCGFNVAEGTKIQTVVAAEGGGGGGGGKKTPPPIDGPVDDPDGRLKRAADRRAYDDSIAGDTERRFRRQEVLIPAVVAGVGFLFLLLNVLVLIPKVDRELGVFNRFVPDASIQVEGLVSSAVLLALQVPCLLGGLFAIAAIFGSSFGELFSALRKLLALGLLAGQIDTTIFQYSNLLLGGAGGIAWMLQAAVSFTIFWIVSKLMFDELEPMETIGLWFAVGFIPSLLITGYFLFF
ncbi:MAG: hypothetical protein AAFX76_12330, partial [Planctomycetota bacterium]